MKVTDWCKDHGISKANYYYRLRQVRRAYLALSMIQAIFREEKILKELPAEERENADKSASAHWWRPVLSG